ncbi:hypothetical protein BDV09DRAFT_173690 [Aspergillus tetrazonus]
MSGREKPSRWSSLIHTNLGCIVRKSFPRCLFSKVKCIVACGGVYTYLTVKSPLRRAYPSSSKTSMSIRHCRWS